MRSPKAVAYIGVIIALGAVILGDGVGHWQTQDWARYLSYCTIAIVASGMKVSLPAVRGTMSMSFLFVLIGIAELSRPETLAMGCLAMLAQCAFFAKGRVKPVQVTFSVASMACSIEAAFALFHAPLLAGRWLELPMLLLVAAAGFFFTNTLSIAAVIGLTESKNIWRVWRDSYFWTFPNYLVGAAIGWLVSESNRHFGWQTSLLLLPVLYVLYRSHTLYIQRLEEEKLRAEKERNHAEEVAALHRRTIRTLALAIEAKDETTSDHLARVEVYAIEIGKALGLNETDLEALRASALLHDIGKLAVPEYIISKPGRLTPEEFEKMKIHTVVGAEILEQVRFPYDVAPIVRSHHEKWDGSGYPDGLAGESIPMGARILAAVDCLDALASDRQYRRALPLEEAIDVVRKEAGKAFDPRVVEVLVGRYVNLEKQAKAAGGVEKKLSTHIRIERGAAPAAGFETSPDTADLLNFHRSVSETGDASTPLANLSRALENCGRRAEALSATRLYLGLIIPYEAMAVYARRGDRLVPEFLDGEDYPLFASLEIPLGMGLSGWVAENQKAILNGNPSVEPGYLNDPAKFSVLRSALAVPLLTDDGVSGVLSLYARDRDAFTKEHLRLLTIIGTKLSRALEGTRLQAHS